MSKNGLGIFDNRGGRIVLQMSLFSLVFQGIPEQIAVAALAFVIARAELDWKKIGLVGVILAVIAYIVRLLPVTFGVHTVVLIMLLFLLVNKFGQVNLVLSIVSAIISFFVLVIVETVIHLAFFTLAKLPVEAVLNNDILNALIGLPQILLIFLTAYVIKKIRR